MAAGLDGLLHLLGHTCPPNVFPQQGQGSHTLDDPHPSGIHSKWQLNGLWGLWRAGGLQSHLWALSADTRLPDELRNFVNSVRSVCPLCWRHVLPEVLSNLSSTVPSANLTLCSTLGLLSELWPNLQCAFVEVHGLWQHVPLFPNDDCLWLWWGHVLQPNVLILMQLHQGLISLCLDPIEWLLCWVYLPLCYHILSSTPIRSWIMQGHWPINDP